MNKLKIVHGEICYLSEENDQTYGMWCPVGYYTRHNYKEGEYLIPESEIQQLRAENDELKNQILKNRFFSVDVIRCLKTLAFEHNHDNVTQYANLAKKCIKEIETKAAKGE